MDELEDMADHGRRDVTSDVALATDSPASQLSLSVSLLDDMPLPGTPATSFVDRTVLELCR